MGTHRTAEEAKQRYIAHLGEPLGTLFSALWQELAWLNWKWIEYRELYGTKASRIELLNDAAPLFFRIVQDTLWEDSLLHLARLTDPVKSAGRPNLTIRALPDLIEDPKVCAHVSSLIDKGVASTEFCRDWRNRHIAHRDLALALSQGAQPLKEASRLKVKDALKAIEDVLNAVSGHYMDETSIFSLSQSHSGSVSLLHVLHDGIELDKQRLARIERGEYNPADLGPSDL